MGRVWPAHRHRGRSLSLVVVLERNAVDAGAVASAVVVGIAGDAFIVATAESANAVSCGRSTHCFRRSGGSFIFMDGLASYKRSVHFRPCGGDSSAPGKQRCVQSNCHRCYHRSNLLALAQTPVSGIWPNKCFRPTGHSLRSRLSAEAMRCILSRIDRRCAPLNSRSGRRVWGSSQMPARLNSRPVRKPAQSSAGRHRSLNCAIHIGHQYLRCLWQLGR